MENAPAAGKKRRRPPLACEACRRRKVKCDRKSPCDNCVRTKRASNCSYVLDNGSPSATRTGFSSSCLGLVNENGVTQDDTLAFTFGIPVEGTDAYAERAQSATQSTPVTNFLAQSTNAGPSPPVSHPSNDSSVGNPLAERVRQLEQQLSQLRQTTKTQKPVETLNTKGLLLKTRYVGQSHWMNGARLYPMLTSLIRRIEADRTSTLFKSLCSCKKLAKVIKNKRVPSMVSINFGQHMPSRNMADQLVDAYLRTFEGVYRIIHIPSFKREYGAYWENPAAATQSFIIQLQLCMAVGACFLDDTFSYRHLATQWIYEAQFWFVQPSEKSRMNIQGLQALCLLYLARETCSIGADLVWVSVGNLARTAMFMGFHRDPEHLPKMSMYVSEMRRRLWATILELVLAASLESGCPPLIGPKDFDTKPPSNFDDVDLGNTSEPGSISPKPISVFTDTSMQILLFRSFDTRLAISRHLNEFDTTNTYDETLKLHRELTAACRNFTASVQKFHAVSGIQARGPLRFHVKLAELSLHRIFMVLHMPWLAVAEQDPRYYYSRKICVETALRLFKGMVQYKNSSPSATLTTPPLASLAAPPFNTQAAEHDDFLRLLICGCGSFRTVPVQCFFTIGLELVWQREEDRGMNADLDLRSNGDAYLADDFEGLPGMSRAAGTRVRAAGGQSVQESELLEGIRYAPGWAKARVLAGETNVKGYLFMNSLLKQIEALQRGAPDEEVEKVIEDCIEETVKESVDILKRMAANEGSVRAGSVAGSVGRGPGSNGEFGMDGLGFDVEAGGVWSGSVSDWDWDEMLQERESSAINFNLQGLDIIFGNT